MSLEAMRADCLICTDCRLAERRRSVVFGEGDSRSPLVLVGEGPGDEEDKTGRPFVGRAGQMLDRALAECGLCRDQIYICNTVKCRAADWSTGKPKNRPPQPDEVAACRSWLLPQLASIAPEIILCIGAPSAKNLIKPQFKITQERGIILKSEFATAIMATLHPAYIMRQQRPNNDGGFHLLVEDIGKAWGTAVTLREQNGGTS